MPSNRANLRLVTPSGQEGREDASPSPAPVTPPGVPRVQPPALDDTELLTLMRSGDPSAASALHDRVRSQVDRTIARLLGRRDVDHDDLAQLAMIELVYTIDRFRGDCSLDSWTSTITAHVVYKHIRRRKTERRLFGAADAHEELPFSSRSDTGKEAMLRNVMHRVRGHLDGIDENKAWTFLLHDVCGYDLQEIAQITGVSVSAAQTRLVRGRRELHERIALDPELANLMQDLEGGR
jgi:RNA polymerase sigma-70 factor (ECF subfamily)